MNEIEICRRLLLLPSRKCLRVAAVVVAVVVVYQVKD